MLHNYGNHLNNLSQNNSNNHLRPENFPLKIDNQFKQYQFSLKSFLNNSVTCN